MAFNGRACVFSSISHIGRLSRIFVFSILFSSFFVLAVKGSFFGWVQFSVFGVFVTCNGFPHEAQ